VRIVDAAGKDPSG